MLVKWAALLTALTANSWTKTPVRCRHIPRLARGTDEYEDTPGFCKSATLDEIRSHDHILTPGRYVGAKVQEDDGEPFEEKMATLAAQWRDQQAEGARLDMVIAENLKNLGFGE